MICPEPFIAWAWLRLPCTPHFGRCEATDLFTGAV